MPQTHHSKLQDGIGFSDKSYSKRVPALATAQREFDERKSPQHWFTKSLNLSQSARLIWEAGESDEGPALLAVGLMLDAMSLELATKGTLIGKSGTDPASTAPIS